MANTAIDIPPAARRAIDDLGNAATTPVKALIGGGIGTGKTIVLAAARESLRNTGLTILTRPPRADDPVDAAVVVDDAHLLTDAELLRLAECATEPGTTLVVATELHEQNAALRAVTTAIERDRPRVLLGPLPVAENLRASTAGLPFLIRAASGDAQPPTEAAKFALLERLRRLDERLLDTLLIMSLNQELGGADIAAALSISAADARQLTDSARASGLVDPAHPPLFVQSVHDVVAQIVGNAHHREIETCLLRTQLDSSAVSPDLALRLAEHGLRDDRLAAVLAEHAMQTRGTAAHTARLYQAAVDAGANGLTSRMADALARAGECAVAAKAADGLLASADSDERAAAVRIAASVATHDGNADQAAELFGWLGPHPDAVVGSAAAITLATTGNLAMARTAVHTKDAGPPTMAARASRNLAEGLLMTMDKSYPVAMAKLGQAISTDELAGEIMPDSAAAVVTLAAIHGGDPGRARSVIGRAVRAGSDVFYERRHQLLSGWIKMQEGQLSSTAAELPTVRTDPGPHRRDALWSAALQTAIARRNGDAGALHQHWHAAMEVLAEYSLDLFALLPLGELWVAAARMRQVARLQHTLDQAFALLDSLGNPPLWSASLHWAGVHAGILSNSPDSVAPHGQALSAAAAHSTFAQALSVAGRTWLRVLADHVAADEVTTAARSLAHVGLTSDATRLAGQAALQTSDPRVSGAMLQLARDLKLTAGPGDTPNDLAVEPGNAAPSITTLSSARQPPTGSPLSDREREVAQLLLLGMPYRDIGAQLFISPKTVEHHVARIRRRLGAGSRSEMLSMLRALLAPQG